MFVFVIFVNVLFSLVSNGTFIGCFVHRVPPMVLKVVRGAVGMFIRGSNVYVGLLLSHFG